VFPLRYGLDSYYLEEIRSVNGLGWDIMFHTCMKIKVKISLCLIKYHVMKAYGRIEI
jgi:hypothetical protein